MATTSSKEGKSYFAFFDLDHTLAGTVSGRELALAAYRKGLMKRSDLLSAIWLSFGYRMKLLIPEEAITKMGSWVKGMTAECMTELCIEVTDKTLIPAVYREVEGELQRHRSENAGLVILSSTVEQVCKRMAEQLGMDDTVCTRLEAIDGILTGRPLGRFCFGVEKERRLKEYCEKNNSKLQDAWYYGDAVSDLHALGCVGHPVCINPERKLEGIARERGWKINYWK
jgi:HAD superfamily hydrolase (TIGR01490 family)